MKTVLVTGGAGFIGSHTVDRLLQEGYTVVAVDCFNDYYDPKVKEKNLEEALQNPLFHLYRVDILDSENMRKIFREYSFDVVIHLAARGGVRPSIKDPQLYNQVNIVGTTNILECMKEFGVKQLVFSSSSSVYGANIKIPFSETDDVSRMISPYAVTKRAGELLCSCYAHLYGFNIACLRFFTVYGPRGRPDMAPYIFTSRIMQSQPIERYGDGSTLRDYTFILDVVDGILAAMHVQGYEIFNLGNNNPVSLQEFIATIEAVTGKKADIIQKPMQEGDVPLTYADLVKSSKMLGYKPKVSLREGLEKLYLWMKQK